MSNCDRALFRLQLDRHDLALEVALLDRRAPRAGGSRRENASCCSRVRPYFGRDVLRGDPHVAVAERIVQRADHRVDDRARRPCAGPSAGGQEVRRAAHATRRRPPRRRRCRRAGCAAPPRRSPAARCRTAGSP